MLGTHSNHCTWLPPPGCAQSSCLLDLSPRPCLPAPHVIFTLLCHPPLPRRSAQPSAVLLLLSQREDPWDVKGHTWWGSTCHWPPPCLSLLWWRLHFPASLPQPQFTWVTLLSSLPPGCLTTAWCSLGFACHLSTSSFNSLLLDHCFSARGDSMPGEHFQLPRQMERGN